MFFKFIGVTVCVIFCGFIGLILLGQVVTESQKNQSPTVISGTATTNNNTDIDILKYLSEGQSANTVAAPFEDTEGYKAQCLDAWTKRGVVNYEMVNYCVSREHEGYAQLVTLLHRYGGYSWMQGVLEKNITEWTKRGARTDSQVAYGVEREIDAFLNLKYRAEHSGIKQGAANECLDRWSNGSIQWTMLEYCYKNMVGEN